MTTQKTLKFTRRNGTPGEIYYVPTEGNTMFRIVLDYGRWNEVAECETMERAVLRVLSEDCQKQWPDDPGQWPVIFDVAWAANGLGYIVEVYGDGELVEQYTAGNSPMCSQTYVSEERGLGVETMRKFAEQTANEFAEKYGAVSVSEDEDMQESI